MKALLLLLSFSFFVLSAHAQAKEQATTKPNPDQEMLMAEAACGQCKFDLPGNGCNLAVRLKGKAYFVEGTDIDAHGDAHASDGFCQAIRQANVQGKLVNNRLVVSYFKLLPAAPATANPKK